MSRAFAAAPLFSQGQALGLALAAERQRAMSVPQRRPAGSPISIAITSGKGGVGKTTVTANLAALWARRGRRTLVIDADLGLAGLDLALGVEIEHDLGDVIDGRASIDEVLVTGPFGVTLLPAASGRAELASLGTAARASLMCAVAELSSRFEVVIIDTGAGIGATVLDFASLADEILLVITPDPVALRDAYAMAKILEKRAGIRELRVLANQLPLGTDGMAVHQRLAVLVERFLDVRLSYAGGLRHDAAIAESAAHGVPFVLSEPSSLPARVLSDLVTNIDREVVRAPC